ncbi:hypothetical protein JXL21_10975 [Candidatus Bathyarchaeota archaeon]|nr:hypothetical protein [Candidatus Bathyarchaeota archaeon]
METPELRKRIEEAIALLENYRSFGPMVGEGIEAFRRIDACVEEPTPERVAEARTLLDKLNSEIGPYQSYVPSVALVLHELTEWVKGQ